MSSKAKSIERDSPLNGAFLNSLGHVKFILSGSTRKIREIWKMGMIFEGTLR
jgi:hypothetical protein